MQVYNLLYNDGNVSYNEEILKHFYLAINWASLSTTADKINTTN